MNESPEHDADVLHGLIDRTEASMRALQTGRGVPDALRDQAIARRAGVDELRAAAPAPHAGGGDGLLEKAQRALERFAADTSDGPVASGDAGDLAGLEQEEQALQARFEAALADDRLSGPARDAVLRAYDRLKPGRDAIRQAALGTRGEA